MDSLVSLFNRTEKVFSSNTAINDTGRLWSFSELKQASDALALNLIENSISKGDRIALYCVNSAEFAIAYMAILKAGAVVVPVNLLQKPAEIEFILNDALISGLIYHEKFQSAVGQVVPKLTKSLFTILIGKEGCDFDSIINTKLTESAVPIVALDSEQDLAAILYTSGTTGKPKGAMLTHANLAANTESVFTAMKWRAGDDSVLLVLPMFHAFAATVGMLTPLTHGCCFVPLAKFDNKGVLDAIETSQATIFLGVPSMYNVLLNTADENTNKFNSIRFCISGGASMPVEVLTSFEAKFSTKIYEGDGPTECSPVTCVNPIDGLQKIGTVGLPVPNVEMCIFDELGNELPHGEIGEIAVRAPSVMKGYWNMPEATAESFKGDWFLTGDLGTEDNDGYFSILDRKKDMVIVNGMNVYPRIIEEVLYRFEGILEAAVIGVKDKTHGEIPVAYIVLKEAVSADSSDVRAWCRQYLANYEVPRKVIFMKQLPKNGAGKIVKRVLNKQGEVERGIQSL